MNNDTTIYLSQKIKFECNRADNCQEINLQLIQVGKFTNEYLDLFAILPVQLSKGSLGIK